MYCKYCRNKIDDDSVFCKYCGRKLSGGSPLSGSEKGHKGVDLGLSVKWATCNVGASSPSGYGNYYAWGETTTESEYTQRDSVTFGKQMGSIAGNPQYDAATANWGGKWRMPTKEEIDELKSKCNWKWVEMAWHKGYKVTGPNGRSIFLPAAGWRKGMSLNLVGKFGCYWSATPDGDDASRAFSLYFLRSCFGTGGVERPQRRAARSPRLRLERNVFDSFD